VRAGNSQAQATTLLAATSPQIEKALKTGEWKGSGSKRLEGEDLGGMFGIEMDKPASKRAASPNPPSYRDMRAAFLQSKQIGARARWANLAQQVTSYPPSKLLSSFQLGQSDLLEHLEGDS